MKKTKKAFTFIELLVVVIILGILATLSFLFLGDFLKEARDTTRIDNLKEIENKLDYYQNKTGELPEPDNFSTGEIDGRIRKIGKFATGVVEKIKDSTIIPLDPRKNTPYDYQISETGGLYKLKTKLEMKSEEYIIGN